MPASIEAAIVFAVLIVPGLQLISGYRWTRAHTLPRRDLYVLAQAVAVSLAWLPVVWLLGGDAVLGWLENETANDHQLEILGIVLLNLAVPLLVGLSAGLAIREMADRPDFVLTRALKWTGIFEPPTAWDAAWIQADRGEWAAVRVTLRSGDEFGVLFDDGSTVGLSPAPRDLFFDTEYRVEADGSIVSESHEGIYIDGSEVVSLRLEYIEPES